MLLYFVTMFHESYEIKFFNRPDLFIVFHAEYKQDFKFVSKTPYHFDFNYKAVVIGVCLLIIGLVC